MESREDGALLQEEEVEVLVSDRPPEKLSKERLGLITAQFTTRRKRLQNRNRHCSPRSLSPGVSSQWNCLAANEPREPHIFGAAL